MKNDFVKKIKLGYNFPFCPSNKKGKYLLIYIRRYLLMKKKLLKIIYIKII